MIIVDTNIISEFMCSRPDPAVIEWFNHQNSRELYVTVITLAEIGYGLRLMPTGHKTKALNSRFNGFVAKAFEERVLDFDKKAADAYIELMACRKEMGLPMSIPDGQIAAIASSQKLCVSTRNTKDFTHCGIEIINPFEAT